MAVTKTIVQNSSSRTKIKINADAAVSTGQAWIYINKAVTLTAAGNLTLNAGANGTATIVRAAGTWAGDVATATTGSAVLAGGSYGTSSYGGYLYIDLTSVTGITNVADRKVYTVLSVSGTTATVAEVINSTQSGITNTGIAGYYSDVGFYNQGMVPAAVNVAINSIIYSVPSAAANNINVVRNSVSVAYLSGANHVDVQMPEQGAYDINTIIAGGGGFMIVELVKLNGFVTDSSKV